MEELQAELLQPDYLWTEIEDAELESQQDSLRDSSIGEEEERGNGLGGLSMPIVGGDEGGMQVETYEEALDVNLKPEEENTKPYKRKGESRGGSRASMRGGISAAAFREQWIHACTRMQGLLRAREEKIQAVCKQEVSEVRQRGLKDKTLLKEVRGRNLALRHLIGATLRAHTLGSPQERTPHCRQPDTT